MRGDRKQKQQELIDALQARVGASEFSQMMDLLRLLLEEALQELIHAAPADVARLQGEAQTYDKLMRMLRRPNIKSLTSKE